MAAEISLGKTTGTIVKVVPEKSYGLIIDKNNRKAKFLLQECRDFTPAVGIDVAFDLFPGSSGPDSFLAKNVKMNLISAASVQDRKSEKGGERSFQDRSTLYFLPADTRDLLMNKRTIPDNFSLLLNKYLGRSGTGGGENKFKVMLSGRLEEFTVLNEFNYDEALIKEVNRTNEEALKQLCGDNLVRVELELSGRLLVGHGVESVHETSMTLHHVYGLPYIPGQALKGVVRNYVIGNFFKDEKTALRDENFCILFGCTKDSALGHDYQGSLKFFDCFPKVVPKIEVDIMNPHFTKYYSENKPPADYLDPVPVFFLTVANTGFTFNVGYKPAISVKLGDMQGENKDIIKNLLTSALTEHGIGAKTAVGYGYFRE